MEIGNRLREARRALDVDLTACEQATKIRAKYLMALEDEDFGVLPEPVFVRGMLRTYAQWLGLDPAPLLEQYAERIGEPPRTPAPPANHAPAPRRPRPTFVAPSRRGPRRPRTGGRVVALIIGGLVVVGLLVWQGSRSGDDITGTVAAPTVGNGPEVMTVPVVTGSGTRVPTAPPVLVLMGTSAMAAQVQVHQVDAEGPMVFQGALERGQRRRIPVRGPLWVHVAAGGTVAARLGGRTIAVPTRDAGTVVERGGVRTS